MRVNAYAKINWCLRILSREVDGYHKIATLFQSVSLKDTLVFKKITEGFSFSTNSEVIPKDSANLVLRAVEALCNKIKKVPSGLEVFLEKNIPVEAGLGGGSADAAVALNALNVLWKLGLPEKELLKIASAIGADVSFNVKGGLAEGLGRGEKLKFYSLRRQYRIIIVKPNIGVSTKWAYEEFDKINAEPVSLASAKEDMKNLIAALNASDFENIKKYAVNDFEKVVYPKYPQIENIKNKLIKTGALAALLSGSGSSVFGVFENKEKTEKAFKHFSEKKNIKAFITETVRGLASQKL